MPRSRAAARMVVPAGTVTSRPSMVAWMVAVSAPAGPVMPPPFACSTAASWAAPTGGPSLHCGVARSVRVRAAASTDGPPRARGEGDRVYNAAGGESRGGESAGAGVARARASPVASVSPGRGPLGPVADAAQHALFHDEVGRLEAERLGERGRHGAPPGGARADDEPGLGGDRPARGRSPRSTPSPRGRGCRPPAAARRGRRCGRRRRAAARARRRSSSWSRRGRASGSPRRRAGPATPGGRGRRCGR